MSVRNFVQKKKYASSSPQLSGIEIFSSMLVGTSPAFARLESGFHTRRLAARLLGSPPCDVNVSTTEMARWRSVPLADFTTAFILTKLQNFIGLIEIRHDTTPQCVVAQHGRAFLPRPHPEPATSWSVSRSGRTLDGDWRLYRSPQRESQTLHLNGARLRYLGKGQTRSSRPR